MKKLTYSQRKLDLFAEFKKADIIEIHGGSSSGKTLQIVDYMCLRLLKYPNQISVITRKFSKSLQALITKTFLKEVAIARGLVFEYNKTEKIARFSNGSELWFLGTEDSEKILSARFMDVLMDEATESTFDVFNLLTTRLHGKETDHKMFLLCNPVGKKHWIYKEIIKGNIPNVFVKQLNYDPTEEYADPNYMNQFIGRSAKHIKRFLEGEWGDDLDGTVFDSSSVYHASLKATPDDITKDIFRTICIAVDPAVTTTDKSDETGIVVGGYTKDGEFLIIDNLTAKLTPDEVGYVLRGLCEKWDIETVYVESNNGGDYLINTYRRICSVNYIKVHAGTSKVQRAEPIASMYSDGLVYHLNTVGNSKLEESQLSWCGRTGEASPNDIDALVHLLTKLKGKYLPRYGLVSKK